MNILHICAISNNKSSGISNVVPEHFINQSKLENVALLNCTEEKIHKLQNQKNVFYLNELKGKGINNLPQPFNRPDVVIFHGIYIPKYISIAKKINKIKIPYIIIPHGSLTKDAQKIKAPKKIIANIIFFNNFIKKASAIQYLSTSEKDMSSSFYNKSYVLGNGMKEFKIKKTNFSHEGLKLIYIGRYDIYHKGLDIMINSCKLIKEYMNKNKITLSLYGTGGDGINKIKKLVEDANLESIINVNGPIFESEKLETIISNDVFIQTSRLEGQPLGIMEALALGMPVIVTDGTTFGEAVNEKKLGYSGNDAQEIGELIKKMNQSKKLLNSLSKNCVQYARNNFTWNIIAKKSIEEYKNIVIGEK